VNRRKEAEKIADVLVKEKLAACAQVLGPTQSIYKWKGKMQNQKEWLCLIKTSSGKYKKIEGKIKSLHSYEVPEIIVFEIKNGNKEYLNWISKQL